MVVVKFNDDLDEGFSHLSLSSADEIDEDEKGLSVLVRESKKP